MSDEKLDNQTLYEMLDKLIKANEELDRRVKEIREMNFQFTHEEPIKVDEYYHSMIRWLTQLVVKARFVSDIALVLRDMRLGSG